MKHEEPGSAISSTKIAQSNEAEDQIKPIEGLSEKLEVRGNTIKRIIHVKRRSTSFLRPHPHWKFWRIMTSVSANKLGQSQ